MQQDCIFCKIATKQIPKEFIYEDETVMVFPDIHPVRQVHILVVPKEHIPELLEVTKPELFSKMMIVAQKMIKDQKLEGQGYRVTINGGGAQMVPHLHIHIMGPLTKAAAM